MPRLLVYGICQKAIIDREDSTVSMISILSGISVTVKAGIIEPDAAILLPWGAVTTWLRLPDDENKAYEQKIDVLSPNGDVSGESVVPFVMNRRSHQNAVSVNGFPVGIQGEYKVRLWLRETQHQDQPWTIIADYPVEVTHIAEESPSTETD